MNECPDVMDLALLAGGDLEAMQTDLVKAHLAACAECTQTYAELLGDGRLLRETHELPDNAYLPVRAKVMRTLRARSRRPFAWAAAGIAAAVAAICILLYPQEQHLALARPNAPGAPVPVHAVNTQAAPQDRTPRPLPKRATSSVELYAALDALVPREPEAPPPFSGSSVVIIPTRDPDVTIILLQEATKGSQ